MPAKMDRCVRKVKARGGSKSPWAVCQAAMAKKKKKTKRGY